LKSLILVILSI